MSTTAAAAQQSEASAPGVGIPFTVASRPQRRFSNTQEVNNLNSSGSFQIVQLAATGWVRKVSLFFTQSFAAASAAATVAGDGPWNLIRAITLTDATGQPVVQPISGFNAYLVNKYLPGSDVLNFPNANGNPHLSPEFAYAASSGTGSATWRIDLDFEIDHTTGYGCIPNLDSNASLQLKVDFDQYNVAFSGTTVSAASLSMRVEQDYWAPVGSSIGGHAVSASPPGAGDYVETRYETQTVSPSSENLISLTNRGGLVKGVLLVSRAAGVRTAFTAKSNVGILLDNQPINEGITLESHYDQVRRSLGYYGADLSTSYAPLTPGVMPGLDRGVLPLPFFALSGGRNSWLNTRGGSLFQVKATPGASASTIEVVTQLTQVKEAASFYNVGV